MDKFKCRVRRWADLRIRFRVNLLDLGFRLISVQPIKKILGKCTQATKNRTSIL